MSLTRVIFSLLFLAMVFLALVLWKPYYESLSTGGIMGTTYSIKWISKGSNKDNFQIKGDIKELLTKINNSMSTYEKTSDLSRFNRASVDEWINVSPDTIRVTKIYNDVYGQTNGALNPTLSKLVDLWGFGTVQKNSLNVPSNDLISDALSKVKFENVIYKESPPKLMKSIEGLTLDYSASAKGYAVDMVAEYFLNNKINNFFVEIGGEIRTHGHALGGNTWKAGVEAPAKTGRKIQEIIKMNNISLATSGTYRNYFDLEGNSYSHILDSKTGKPVTHNLKSVSVLHSSCAYADAYATALLVLGPELGFKFAEDNSLAALFIIKQNDNFLPKATSHFNRYKTQ